jgi:hypothetical protein
MSMQSRTSVGLGLGTVFFAFITTLVIGILVVAFNHWFGSGDLFPFAIYSVPFALLTWPVTSFVFSLSQRYPAWLVLPFAFLSGLIYGYIATYAVALLLGPWFGAMSVPLLRVWCSAGALTFAATVLVRRSGFNARNFFGVLVSVAATILLFVGSRPALALATSDQHLTVIFFRHHPGTTALSITDPPPIWASFLKSLDDRDLELLKQTGLKGTLEFKGSHASNAAKWPVAKALIICTNGLHEDVTIPQPKHCTIVYVQTASGFLRVPQDAPTFPRTIRFEGSHMWVEHASAARSGGEINP